MCTLTTCCFDFFSLSKITYVSQAGSLLAVSLPYKIIYLTVYTRIYPFISIDLFISWFPCSGRKNVVTVGDAHVSWECKLFITITTTVSALWCKWQFIQLHWFDWPVVLIKGKCSNVNQASILQAPSSVRRCRVTSSDRHTLNWTRPLQCE